MVYMFIWDSASAVQLKTRSLEMIENVCIDYLVRKWWLEDTGTCHIWLGIMALCTIFCTCCSSIWTRSRSIGSTWLIAALTSKFSRISICCYYAFHGMQQIFFKMSCIFSSSISTGLLRRLVVVGFSTI